MIKELENIQCEYLILLKSISNNLENENLLDSLDLIQMFWFRKRNVILMASTYLFNNHNVYFLTAVSFFDVSYRNQNIFCVNGDYQVFDDPIPSYLEIISNGEISETIFESYVLKLEKAVKETIQDEILLLEESRGNFYILPLRYYVSEVLFTEDCGINMEKFLQNFFSTPTTLSELSAQDNLNEVVNNDNLSKVVFFDGDNPNNPISERMKCYMEQNKDIIPSGFNVAQTLYFTLFGYFQQAMNVLEVALNFNVFPFFRSFSTYNNYSLILHTMIEGSNVNEEKILLKKHLIKSALEYLLFYEYSKRNVSFSLNELKERAAHIDLSGQMESLELKCEFFENVDFYVNEINFVIDKLLEIK